MEIDGIEARASITTQTHQDDDHQHFVYSHAIQVHSFSMEHAHNMGVTLSLIIIFNLALSHHMIGVKYHETRYLKKAMQLYELAYQLHVDEQQAQILLENSGHKTNEQDPAIKMDPTAERMGILRFTMIVSNNLGEIHRVVHNHVKHTMCLQHLLSTIMYVVDGHLREIGSAVSSSASSGGSRQNSSLTTEEMDGFLRNTAAIMFHDVCASAA
jgi:hypothetical protein